MWRITYVVLIILLIQSSIWAQLFDKAQTNFVGVMQPVMTWIDYGEEVPMKAFLAGDYYRDDAHYVISQINTHYSKSKFKKITSLLPPLYRGDIAAADYDDDGDEDIILTGLTEGDQMIMRLYRNDGPSRFTAIKEMFIPVTDGSVEWGDFDNDEDLDILVTGKQFNNQILISIYRNDKGIFSQTIPNIPGVYNGNATWGDYDNDKDLDILITGNTGTRPVTAVYNNTNSKYNRVVQEFIPLKNSAGAWGDLDGDQYLDFIISGEDVDGYPVCMIYSNQKGSFFREEPVSIRPLRNCSIDLGDYDSDGDLDVVMTGESLERSYSIIYENNRGFDLENIMAGLPGVAEGNAIFGDYDKDGDLDILIAGLTICYDFIGDIYINTTDPPDIEIGNNIFINSPNPSTKIGPYYYYVFSSCYCDPSGGNNNAYHMYVSNIHLQNKRYELNHKFNEILVNTVPNWGDTDRGYRTSNGFKTKKEAEISRNQVVESYKATNFTIHEINW